MGPLSSKSKFTTIITVTTVLFAIHLEILAAGTLVLSFSSVSIVTSTSCSQCEEMH